MKISIDTSKEKTLPITVGSVGGFLQLALITVSGAVLNLSHIISFYLFYHFLDTTEACEDWKKIALHNRSNVIHCHHCFLKVHAHWIVIFRESQCFMHQHASTDAGQPFKLSSTKQNLSDGSPNLAFNLQIACLSLSITQTILCADELSQLDYSKLQRFLLIWIVHREC